MSMTDQFDFLRLARLVKGRRVTLGEQVLLRIVDTVDWGHCSLNLSNSFHRVFAARAVALGCPVFYGFGNFYALTAHPHQACVECVNRAKGRPSSQVGSITTTREHIPDLFDWHQLPEGLQKEQMLAVIDAFYEMGPFGFRGPAVERIPAHLTTIAENGKRTSQIIAPGYSCLSNRFLQKALACTREEYLFITSANISSNLTGQEEPAHYAIEPIQREFQQKKSFLMMRHANEEEARARYPYHAAMSTSIIGFHEVRTDNQGKPALIIERHGSLPLDKMAEVLNAFGFGYVLGPKAHIRLSQREYAHSLPS